MVYGRIHAICAISLDMQRLRYLTLYQAMLRYAEGSISEHFEMMSIGL